MLRITLPCENFVPSPSNRLQKEIFNHVYFHGRMRADEQADEDSRRSRDLREPVPMDGVAHVPRQVLLRRHAAQLQVRADRLSLRPRVSITSRHSY